MELRTKIMIGVGGALALAALFGGKQAVAAVRRTATPTPAPKALRPAAVRAGELVSASTFQYMTARRAGYIYAPAKLIGNLIRFTSPVDGEFTRYVVKQGTQLFAEIKKIKRG